MILAIVLLLLALAAGLLRRRRLLSLGGQLLTPTQAVLAAHLELPAGRGPVLVVAAALRFAVVPEARQFQFDPIRDRLLFMNAAVVRPQLLPQLRRHRRPDGAVLA